MANTKEYKIVINGLTESANAVESLNKQLDALDAKITALQTKSVKIGNLSSGGGRTSSKSELSEEDKLLKQIEQTDKKIKAYSKDIYQNYLAAKDVLKETLNDQKELAAKERLQANTYGNTMAGLKQKLYDIKVAMQTTEIGGDMFKNYIKEANELTNKLKEIEAQYGQFGRNVGNYKSAAEGFNKIKVAVGDTVREYDNYRKALKELQQERFALSQTLGTEAKEYKEIDVALKQLQSDYQDLNKSSAFMDEMLDTMQGFASLASVGVGLSGLFGIDDEKFKDTMQKFASLTLVLQGIENLQLQIQKNEGIGKIFNNIGKGIEDFSSKLTTKLMTAYAKLTGFAKEVRMWNSMTVQEQAESIEAYQKYVEKLVRFGDRVKKVFTVASVALKTFVTTAVVFALPEIMEMFTNIYKSLNSTKTAADNATQSLKALNREVEKRIEVLSSSYLRKEITDEEYLSGIYNKQTEAIVRQIDYLNQRAQILNDKSWYEKIGVSSENVEYTGNRLTGETKIGKIDLGLDIAIKDIKELETEWKKCNEAVKEGKDYFSKWGSWLESWTKGLFTTASQTQEMMRGLGNIGLSDFIARFQEVTKQLNEGKISTEQFAKELAKLRTEMNDSEILNSVIANLDKYIPDEETRQAIQNIIDKIYELDDAFNMTSPQQIHYWNQVRIDAMADGLAKEKAQIDENERYEIQQYGKTQEQITLIQAKYQRQRLNAQQKAAKESQQKAKDHNKKLLDLDNLLIRLRLENLKEGLDKQLKLIEDDRRLALQKLANDIKEAGITGTDKAKQLEVETNRKYDQKILDEKRKWAFDTLKVYQDLANRIKELNKGTFDINSAVDSSANEVTSQRKRQNTGSRTFNPANYADIQTLEKYYKDVLKIEQDAADEEYRIQLERLNKEVEIAKEEEKLRHERLLDINGGEYAEQLRAGKITQEQYDKFVEDENKAHHDRMIALDSQYFMDREKLEQDNLDDSLKRYNTYFNNVLSSIQKQQSKIQEKLANAVVTDKYGFGIINLSKTSANYDALIQQQKDIITKLSEERDKLIKEKSNYSAEDWIINMDKLDSDINNAKSMLKTLTDLAKDNFGQFWSVINQYIQQLGRSIQDTLSAVYDYQDYLLEKEQDELDKYNEMLDKKLEKQQEIVEKHKDAIDSIEDELADARGSRRQHLIDQLNAEMQAQREAAAQEKKIKKEQEAAEKKQEQLDKKRREQEYKRNVMQAFVSWHLGVANALATQPFMPLGIAMGALATVLGAAQYALVKSQRPYAKGGLLEGPSHKQGGIPVGNTGIEVEGKEYVVRKKSTAQNIDLLDYINRSERKLDLSDFISFYASDKPRKVINGMKAKFEDGGTLPTTLDVRDQLQNIVINQDNRPIYVSVVDINNKQEDVRRVQTLAGL